MIFVSLAQWLADQMMPIIQNWPVVDVSAFPHMPQPVSLFLAGFMNVFTPGIIGVIGWRVLAYFLPGGAG